MCCRQAGKATADDYQVVLLAGIDRACRHFIESSCADLVRSLNQVGSVAVRTCIIADTTRAVPAIANVEIEITRRGRRNFFTLAATDQRAPDEQG